MTDHLRSALAARLACEVRYGEPLARHTTYRIGGPARALVLPRTTDDVVSALRVAGETGTAWLPLGLGSNVLVSDAGFDGIVLKIGKGLDRVVRDGPDGSRWTVGAGLPTPRLARQSAAAGHAGAQRLIGVPGSVGGGVYMNAGAHGQDFSAITRTAEVVGASGEVTTIKGAEMRWQYRSSGLDHVVVVAATVELEPGDPARTQQELAQYLKKRKEGTPFDEPCCGSVFRNPEGQTAGHLIDQAGLKGLRVGGAEVSRMHANYIVNSGAAKAADVRALMDQVQEGVRSKFGITLEPEVRLLGFATEV